MTNTFSAQVACHQMRVRLQSMLLVVCLLCLMCYALATPAPAPFMSAVPVPAPAPAPGPSLSFGHRLSDVYALQGQAPPPRAAKFPSSTPQTPALDASAVVNFTVTLRVYTYASWSGLDGTSPKGQDQYINAWNAWLQSNISSAAYARLSGYQSGSITAETQAFVPYNSSNQSAVAAATSAIASISAAVTSSTNSILDASTFGASSGVVTVPQSKCLLNLLPCGSSRKACHCSVTPSCHCQQSSWVAYRMVFRPLNHES